MPTYYEFFAGGGMVRAGLGSRWRCLLANDVDSRKADSYAANWGSQQLRVGDVRGLSVRDLPGRADLSWASFPCQDLSLAGPKAGLDGARSGAFWGFWRLMQELAGEGRAPFLICLENVCGTLTSHGGRDFAAIGAALADCGYRFGALVIDAARFVPQSRPRVFVVAAHRELPVAGAHIRKEPAELWRTPALLAGYEALGRKAQEQWVWWNLPAPAARKQAFCDVLEHPPRGVNWDSESATRRLLALMSPLHRRKVEQAARRGGVQVGGVYRRTRDRVQRAEVRFDGVAGCLRTPAGGSSRQSVLLVEGERVRSRLLTAREAARLMGLPEGYRLPERYNEAYHLLGDGVVAPVVRHLAAHLLEPLLRGKASPGKGRT